MLAQYDVILARTNPKRIRAVAQQVQPRHRRRHGHGTHVSSIIASSGHRTGRYQGVAPGVNLVSVRVLDNQGAGRYFDVIRGIQWMVQNRLTYGIRVLNLSLSAPPNSHYWDDPLNQAVMAAWASGVVVVAAAGNRGPEPMSIGVPGNVPYVITVGAVTDNYEPYVARASIGSRPFLRRRADLRGIRQAGSRRDGRTHPRLRAGQRHARAADIRNGSTADYRT